MCIRDSSNITSPQIAEIERLIKVSICYFKMSNTNNRKASTETAQLVIPAISLDRPEPKQLSTGQFLTLKCQNTPGDADSTTYNLQIP